MKQRHPPTIAIAHAYASVFAMLRRKPEQAGPLAEALLKLAREQGLPLFQATGMMIMGWARWQAGDQGGEFMMREGRAWAREINFRSYEPTFGIPIAELEAKEGRLVEALATLNAQSEVVEQTGEHWLDPEAHRVRGEVLLKCEPPDLAEAETAFRRAIESSRTQKTRTFELWASLSLAKLYQQTGRNHAIASLLGPALVGFSPAPELPEVEEGRRLVATVSPTLSRPANAK